ncbi:hypothetical protein [Halococcus salsus]|uniref:hypothetical protein n=1 Tax=Halococcus salsus TaxID=2162894 RepID=UPI0013581FCA|nr:hypothetical protein [Halococcus salsus]
MSVDSAPAAEQSITGWSLGIRGTALCQYCTKELGEGDEVTAYAYRPVEDQLVSVARLYCSECNHREIEHPALGCYEWLAKARLATTSDVAYQSHETTLTGIEIIDQSGPQGDTL